MQWNDTLTEANIRCAAKKAKYSCDLCRNVKNKIDHPKKSPSVLTHSEKTRAQAQLSFLRRSIPTKTRKPHSAQGSKTIPTKQIVRISNSKLSTILASKDEEGSKITNNTSASINNSFSAECLLTQKSEDEAVKPGTAFQAPSQQLNPRSSPIGLPTTMSSTDEGTLRITELRGG